MIKRKLVMACLFVLAVQLARVCLLADTKDQQMTLAEEIPDGTEVSVSGTVEGKRKDNGSLSQKKSGEIRRNHSERIEISGLYQTGSAKRTTEYRR